MADATPLQPQLISGDKLAALTGLTDRRHRQLAKESWFPSPSHGQYQLIPTLQGLFRYYRERGDAESPRGALMKAQQEGQALRNRLREFEVKQASSMLVPVDDAHEVIRVAFEPLKLLLDAMPDSLGARVNPADPGHASEQLRVWARSVRSTIAKALQKAAKPRAGPTGK